MGSGCCMDNEVEQPWQIVINREAEHAAERERAVVERSVEQSLADSLFGQLLEPFATSLIKPGTGANAESISLQELPWIVDEPPSTGYHPKDPQPVPATANGVGIPMVAPREPPSVKSEPGSTASDSRKRSAHTRDRPRLRAPKGDPSKKHKCSVQGCNYSANGTGHLYRHMLTHNGCKDHKVSSTVASFVSVSTAGRLQSCSNTHVLACAHFLAIVSSVLGPVAIMQAIKQHIFGRI